MPTGVYPRTEEHKKCISQSGIGKHRISPENRAKINEGITKRKGHPQTEETKQKISRSEFSSKSKNKKDPNLILDNKRFQNRLYKVRRKGNGGSHTLGEWETLKARYNWTCPGCGKHEPEIKLTEDHIIPISLGGSNNIENIQPLCRSCNSRKHTKIYILKPIAG